MFTGLVEETGTIQSIQSDGLTARLTVCSELIASDCAIGDSVAVNGCCLTVVAIDDAMLSFDVGNETLLRTSLGSTEKGGAVNLERALRVGDRLGGHYVTGHVDSVVKILSREDAGEWSTIWFELPSKLSGQVAEKGSVAIDGISLTVVAALHDRFSVMLVPHTLSATTLGSRRAGDGVNLETDILAKYVERRELFGGSPDRDF